MALSPEQIADLIQHGVTLGAVALGALLGYVATRGQSKAERVRRKKVLASALLIEMATVERLLRQLYDVHSIVTARGELRAPLLERQLDAAIELFQPDTVRQLIQLSTYVRELEHRRSVVQESVHSTEVADDRDLDPWMNFGIRVKARYVAQSFRELRSALEREGGTLPPLPRPAPVAFTEHLPPLGPPAFPELYSDEELPTKVEKDRLAD
jgi:hypothetical protein